MFEPYSREVFEQSFGRIEKHGIFSEGRMGSGNYDEATISFAAGFKLFFGLAGVLYLLEGLKFDVIKLAVDLFDLAHVDVLHDVAGFRIDRIGPRGLSQAMPFIAATSVSPSVLPPVFFNAS